jgi:hypothetical protein
VNANLVWLASYPKSGNTWVRILLEAFLKEGDDAHSPDINRLDFTHHAASRAKVEAVAGCASSELTHEELDWLRPAAYRMLAAGRSRHLFVKVHDCFRLLDSSTHLFPPDVSLRVIYIVRNPLDVVISFAAHLDVSIDDAIALMSTSFSLGGDDSGVGQQLRQPLGSWSVHVDSWTAQSAIPVQIVRYESLAFDAEAELSRIAVGLGMSGNLKSVASAVKAAEFDRLQAEEARSGFREKSASHRGMFFRSGRPGSWRQELSKGQVDQVVSHHGEMMSRLGYLGSL